MVYSAFLPFKSTPYASESVTVTVFISPTLIFIIAVSNSSGKLLSPSLISFPAPDPFSKDSQIKMIPKNVIENAAEEYKGQIRYLYGSISDYRKQTGKSKKAWEEELKKNSEEQAEKQLLVKAYAYKMKISKESEAYKDKEKEFCEKNGLSKKDMISLYGKKEFQCMVLQELVVAKIIDEATIDEN